MARIIREVCRNCSGRGYIERACCQRSYQDLEKIASPLNKEDWLHEVGQSYQGYQVYRCRHCGALWGCRYQFDAGTGHDDRWAELDPVNPKRHY